MQLTETVKKILENYSSESIAIRSKLCQILMHGKTAGSGNMVILPVDQGFEHGPDRSFIKNLSAYDPDYHFKLSIDAGLSAYAAPFGLLAASSGKFVGEIPTILKMNSSNSLVAKNSIPDQAITGTVKDAVELGCVAIGLTIYPGSAKSLDMIEEAKEVIREAKTYGLASVIWSYPRGGNISKEGETAVDICAYAAHIAALVGAHIIKVKPPTTYVEQVEVKKLLESENIKIDSEVDAIKHVVQACFSGKRLVVFSGGTSKDDHSILSDVKTIKLGGGNGSIIGRNSFQRPKANALKLLSEICNIYAK